MTNCIVGKNVHHQLTSFSMAPAEFNVAFQPKPNVNVLLSFQPTQKTRDHLLWVKIYSPSSSFFPSLLS